MMSFDFGLLSFSIDWFSIVLVFIGYVLGRWDGREI